jgi:hypothetical protein
LQQEDATTENISALFSPTKKEFQIFAPAQAAEM